MSQGITVQDLLPIPDTLDPVRDPDKTEVAHALHDEPTASHALAVADHDDKGLAQEPHNDEVKDLGWEPETPIANPLIGGLANDALWLLLRRFNKQIAHVKAYPHAPPGGLDLQIADEEEFSPDKLRANLERAYMTVGLGLMAFVKHIVRLRSWREKRRTGAFLAAYAVAWWFDSVLPLFSFLLILLIAYPPSRELLFPPAPLALVSAKTGGVQKPSAGVLGSTDSATGAPENYKGEAAEEEANHFVNYITSIALSSVSGKHSQDQTTREGQSDADAPSDRIPDPTTMAVTASNARSAASGDPSHNKAKAPMETAIWNQMRPIMHAIGDASDTWERLGNALSPTPPFHPHLYRYRLAAVLVPLLAIYFVSNYVFLKSITFGIGLGFFGDPIIWRGLDYLNRTFPNWQKLLELRNTLLKGVPTNAQLTITLLRLGEANNAPLPPPPTSTKPPPDEAVEISEEHLRATGADYPLNATNEELKTAMEYDPDAALQNTGADIDVVKSKPHGKKTAKLLSFLKGGVKQAVNVSLGADHVRAKVAGAQHAKQRLGVVPSPSEDQSPGPVSFTGRFNGKRGHVYISNKSTSPCIYFTFDKKAMAGGVVKDEDQLQPIWSVPVPEVKEMKKLGGLGWKAKLIVAWALDSEIAGGLEIVDKQGNSWIVTAMVMRDELFNRLVAMGGQKWEAW